MFSLFIATFSHADTFFFHFYCLTVDAAILQFFTSI